jgi:hypothetical protein
VYCESEQIVKGRCGVGSVSRIRATACDHHESPVSRSDQLLLTAQQCPVRIWKLNQVLTYISALLLVWIAPGKRSARFLRWQIDRSGQPSSTTSTCAGCHVGTSCSCDESKRYVRCAHLVTPPNPHPCRRAVLAVPQRGPIAVHLSTRHSRPD